MPTAQRRRLLRGCHQPAASSCVTERLAAPTDTDYSEGAISQRASACRCSARLSTPRPGGAERAVPLCEVEALLEADFLVDGRVIPAPLR